jgi:exopolyphosphatase/guanosine-5'-triphosphate,3'-diphosphate pyrophosphatase
VEVRTNTADDYEEFPSLGSGGNINKLFQNVKLQEKPLSCIYVNSQYAFYR